MMMVLLAGSSHGLEVGFYHRSCPSAEATILGVVKKEVFKSLRTAPILLRLQFHDCFVEECDGSILLKRENGDDEISAAGNNAGVAGFETIDKAKLAVEQSCPGVVSCADIVVLATRDAVVLVPTGRRDGKISKMSNAANLPDAAYSINTLKAKFRAKGLSEKDFVLLTAGAHTIGLTACFFITPRLDAGDPTINSSLFPILRSKCPKGGDAAFKIPLHWDGERVFDKHIFENIRSGKVVLSFDAVLYQDNKTKPFIDEYATPTTDFASDFAQSMIKLGAIGIKIGTQGEVRRVCNATN